MILFLGKCTLWCVCPAKIWITYTLIYLVSVPSWGPLWALPPEYLVIGCWYLQQMGEVVSDLSFLFSLIFYFSLSSHLLALLCLFSLSQEDYTKRLTRVIYCYAGARNHLNVPVMIYKIPHFSSLVATSGCPYLLSSSKAVLSHLNLPTHNFTRAYDMQKTCVNSIVCYVFPCLLSL